MDEVYFDEVYFIPDVYVVPVDLLRRMSGTADETPEIIGVPLPFVAEIWSPSTGSYDVDRKVPEYQRRGDREIWCIHPYERTVTVWLHGAGSRYDTAVHGTGRIQLAGLEDVSIDLDALFDLG